MLKEIRPAIIVMLVFSLITGIVYPMAITGLAGMLFPAKAEGMLITNNGVVVGSALIGQEFKDDRYFRGRPSATTAADPDDASKTVPKPYNASNSMGSNLGPTSKALADRVASDVARLKEENAGVPVPVDLATSSGSGLDPDISPDAALFQVPRIAKVRSIPQERVRALVEKRTEGRLLGWLGEPRVNVLALNLDLDAMVANGRR